jgi:hypothetical protein
MARHRREEEKICAVFESHSLSRCRNLNLASNVFVGVEKSKHMTFKKFVKYKQTTAATRYNR